MANIDFVRQFIKLMDESIKKNKLEDPQTNKQYFNKLFSLENKFKKLLLKSHEGKDVYQQFMNYILYERKNIITARSFFRERQETFGAFIALAFHKKKSNMLHKFKINYMFIKWAVVKYSGKDIAELKTINDEIISLRKTICEMNLPLVLNRVKLFWARIEHNNVEYLDLIQSAAEGLMTAIDKFVPPYNSVFCSTAIARMVLNMSEGQKESIVNISPREKRILYRYDKAKKILIDEKDILEYVKESFKNVTIKKLYDIVNATSLPVSIDENSSYFYNFLEATGKDTPEQAIINKDIIDKLLKALDNLSTLERKVIKLKYNM